MTENNHKSNYSEKLDKSGVNPNEDVKSASIDDSINYNEVVEYGKSEIKVISTKGLFKLIEKCINHGAEMPIIVWCDMPEFLSQYAKPYCDPWQFAKKLTAHYPHIIANVDKLGSPLSNHHKMFDGDTVRRIKKNEYGGFVAYEQIKLDENNQPITKLFLHAPISYTEVEVGLNSFDYAKQLMEHLHLPSILMYKSTEMSKIKDSIDLSGFEQYLCVDDDSPLLKE